MLVFQLFGCSGNLRSGTGVLLLGVNLSRVNLRISTRIDLEVLSSFDLIITTCRVEDRERIRESA